MRNAECGMGEDGRTGENPTIRAQSASDGSSIDQRSAFSGQRSAVSDQRLNRVGAGHEAVESFAER